MADPGSSFKLTAPEASIGFSKIVQKREGDETIDLTLAQSPDRSTRKAFSPSAIQKRAHDRRDVGTVIAKRKKSFLSMLGPCEFNRITPF